jgi:phage head maturation protease
MADDGSWFEGYAAVFDEVANYEVPGVGMVGEEIRRGAFRKVLGEQKKPIPMLYHHLQEHPPLATTSGRNADSRRACEGFVDASQRRPHLYR